MVKNLPAMQKTQVQSLGREDPLEKNYRLQYSCLENSMEEESGKLHSSATNTHKHTLRKS